MKLRSPRASSAASITAWSFGSSSFGSQGETQLVVVDDLLVGVGDRLLDDIGHDRLAVDFAQVFDRHLPRTEAVDADLPLEVGQLSVQLLREVARRQIDVILPLEPLAQRLRHLHCPIRLVFLAGDPLADFPRVAKTSFSRPRVGRAHQAARPRGRFRNWCGRRESNPHDFRHRNLNPARLPIPPRPRRAPPQRGRLELRARSIPACPPRAREKTTVAAQVGARGPRGGAQGSERGRGSCKRAVARPPSSAN